MPLKKIGISANDKEIMNKTLTFIRSIFLVMCVLLITAYTTTMLTNGPTFGSVVIGIAGGLMFGFALIGLDYFFKRFNLRAFNLAILGLMFGYLLGEALLLILGTLLNSSHTGTNPETGMLLKAMLFLSCIYMGMIMTVRASEELHLSIPFVKLKSAGQKKRDILLDSSILSDTRIIDLASSGIVDDHLIIPRFSLKELQNQFDNGDENAKARARRSLDVLKKLEAIPNLELRYSDVDFPSTKDSTTKLVQLARMLDANIITADMTRIQQSAIEGIRIINIHSLSNSLKPLTHSGEFINIKIQRYGKEPRQGVGYLDDGTMVVVNGGAESIGESIKAQVLSVKHTSSGRMIFCNAADELLNMDMMPDQNCDLCPDMEQDQVAPALKGSQKNYYSL